MWIHDTGCSLKAYRGWVIRNLNLYSDMHRFIAALSVGVGDLMYSLKKSVKFVWRCRKFRIYWL